MTDLADVTKRVIVYPERSDIAPGEVFTTADGRKWVAVTGSVGFKRTVRVGSVSFEVPAGMITDPNNPEPANAITAVPYEDD